MIGDKLVRLVETPLPPENPLEDGIVFPEEVDKK